MNAIEFIAQATSVDPELLNAHTDASNLLQWDSLAHMRLILSLEEQTGRNITATELAALMSVAAVQRWLDDNADSRCR